MQVNDTLLVCEFPEMRMPRKHSHSYWTILNFELSLHHCNAFGPLHSNYCVIHCPKYNHSDISIYGIRLFEFVHAAWEGPTI